MISINNYIHVYNIKCNYSWPRHELPENPYVQNFFCRVYYLNADADAAAAAADDDDGSLFLNVRNATTRAARARNTVSSVGRVPDI